VNFKRTVFDAKLRTNLHRAIGKQRSDKKEKEGDVPWLM
jgi:hypothetical protein